MAYAWLAGASSSVFRYSLVGKADPKEFSLTQGSHVKKILLSAHFVSLALEKSFKRISIQSSSVDPQELRFSMDSSRFADAAISPDEKIVVAASQSSSEILLISVENWKVLGSSVHLLDHTIQIEFLSQQSFLLYSSHASFQLCKLSSSERNMQESSQYSPQDSRIKIQYGRGL